MGHLGANDLGSSRNAIGHESADLLSDLDCSFLVRIGKFEAKGDYGWIKHSSLLVFHDGELILGQLGENLYIVGLGESLGEDLVGLG